MGSLPWDRAVIVTSGSSLTLKATGLGFLDGQEGAAHDGRILCFAQHAARGLFGNADTNQSAPALLTLTPLNAWYWRPWGGEAWDSSGAAVTTVYALNRGSEDGVTNLLLYVNYSSFCSAFMISLTIMVVEIAETGKGS
jgi:hypothetical protein